MQQNCTMCGDKKKLFCHFWDCNNPLMVVRLSSFFLTQLSKFKKTKQNKTNKQTNKQKYIFQAKKASNNKDGLVKSQLNY